MVAAAIEAGHDIPPSFQSPELWDCSVPYYEAWWSLHASRTMSAGFGGVIPQGLLYSEMRLFAKDHGLGRNTDDVDEFVFFMQQMDGVYFEYQSEEQERAKPKGKK